MTIRIGCIGDTGHIAYVFQGLDEIPDARLCAVAKGCDAETLEELRWFLSEREAPPVQFYDDYRDMLNDHTLDVLVAAPMLHLHAEVICEGLRRGLPVFCEKPLALTLDSLAQVREAQQTVGKPLGMMMDFRYAPAFHTARRLVAEGRIGTPTAGYAQKSYKRGKRPDYYRTRETFGGIIPWVGIHAIDWFRWVSGIEYSAVSAAHAKLHYPDYPDMEDAVTCVFELANGGTAAMSFDFLRPAGAPTHGDDRLRLIGEKGVLEVLGRDKISLIDTTGPVHVVPEKPPHGLFADFLLSVANPQHICALSTEDALRVTEVALKTRDAADNRQRKVLF